jgi:hypothetical protein
MLSHNLMAERSFDNQISRLESLREKHASLSARIEDAQKRPFSADFYVKQLKKQKLAVKEQIQALRLPEYKQNNSK